MTPRERMAAALEGRIPDRIPTMELEFQLSKELLGCDFLTEETLKNASPKEAERLIAENAEFMIEVYEKLEYDAFGIHYLNEAHTIETVQRIHQLAGDKFMLFHHGDGTFAIPDGDGMYEFAYRLIDDPEGLHEEAERRCAAAIARNRRLMDAGMDCFILCDDYCFNQGPFISPAHFAEFIAPYMNRIIRDIRDRGHYAIKHTDGDIMPILDQLVAAQPHAIHSLDPMAGVDIAKVKKMVGDKVALIGNVNCAMLQTGTMEEIKESALYCLTHGKPGGGYIYSTSNVPFRGLPLERYLYILDIWKQHRDY